MARSGVREGNARVTAGKSDGVVHIEISEWLKNLFDVGLSAAVWAFRVPRRFLAAGVDTPSDRCRNTHVRAEPCGPRQDAFGDRRVFRSDQDPSEWRGLDRRLVGDYDDR
jgi:hypothetical protein